MQPQDDDIIKAIGIASLIEAKREGKDLEQGDADALEGWRVSNRQLFENLNDRELLLAQVKDLENFRDKDRIQFILDTAFVQQDGEVKSLPRKPNIKVWLRYAAVLVPVIAISVAYLWNSFRSNNDRNTVEARMSVVVPANERAILTLNDGRALEVTGSMVGEVARDGSIIISRSEDGRFTYSFSGAISNTTYTNTVVTPKGAFFKLRLPDGSDVWLNAGSSIRFPAVFGDSLRNVEVRGEAYFEVVPNTKAPFHVNLPDNINVEVLGTHFIVQAYESAENIEATLIEGSVRVSSSNATPTSRSVLLIPEQRASYALRNRTFSVTKIDTSAALSWKNGVFTFGVRPLNETLSEIERWYDVEIQYQSTVPQIQLWGTIDRQMDFEKLLEFLRRSGLRYNRVGPRKIVVLPGT